MVSAPPEIVYVDDSQPGITRKGAGRGWAYYYPDGGLISDRAEKKRLTAIALPPAYDDAWFCTDGNGHILATGYDARRRKQYRYHPDFRSWRESLTLPRALPHANAWERGLLALLEQSRETDAAEAGQRRGHRRGRRTGQKREERAASA